MDRLGRESVDSYFDVEFTAEELRQAQPENLAYGQLLDLATHIRPQTGAGFGSLQAFCADPQLSKSSVLICPQLVAGGRLP